MLTKIIVIISLSIFLVAGQFDFQQQNQDEQQQQDQQQEQPQQDQFQQQEQPQEGGRFDRAVNILGRVSSGLNAAGFGRAGGIVGNVGGILGLFRAEGDDVQDGALFDEETVAALAELPEDQLAAIEDEVEAQQENLQLLGEAVAALSDDELEALVTAVEDEEALVAAMDPTNPQSSMSSPSRSSASSSTPTWAVGLIVLGVLVTIALIVVQIQIVMLFRKRLPSSVA